MGTLRFNLKKNIFGSAATHLTCDGQYYMGFVAPFLRGGSPRVECQESR